MIVREIIQALLKEGMASPVYVYIESPTGGKFLAVDDIAMECCSFQKNGLSYTTILLSD